MRHLPFPCENLILSSASEALPFTIVCLGQLPPPQSLSGSNWRHRSEGPSLMTRCKQHSSEYFMRYCRCRGLWLRVLEMKLQSLRLYLLLSFLVASSFERCTNTGTSDGKQRRLTSPMHSQHLSASGRSMAVATGICSHTGDTPLSLPQTSSLIPTTKFREHSANYQLRSECSAEGQWDITAAFCNRPRATEAMENIEQVTLI